MIFGQKIRELRKNHNNMSQTQLAHALGVSLRTIRGWESEGRSPKSIELYQNLAELFHCDLNFLMSNAQDDSAILSTNTTSQETHQLVEQLIAHFSSGTLSNNELDAIMKALQTAYWNAKSTPDLFSSSCSNS